MFLFEQFVTQNCIKNIMFIPLRTQTVTVNIYIITLCIRKYTSGLGNQPSHTKTVSERDRERVRDVSNSPWDVQFEDFHNGN